MNKAQALYKKYKADLKELQESCPHEELTKFMNEWESPGHSTGRVVQLCKECNKVVHYQTTCWNCLESILDDNGYKGNPEKHGYGGHWCSEACANEAHDRGRRQGYAGPAGRTSNVRDTPQPVKKDKK